MLISDWSSDVCSSDLTIDLCLSVFPWARAVHAGHGGIKLHTLLDIRGAIPTVLHVTPAQQHDVHTLDRLVPETGALYRSAERRVGQECVRTCISRWSQYH